MITSTQAFITPVIATLAPNESYETPRFQIYLVTDVLNFKGKRCSGRAEGIRKNINPYRVLAGKREGKKSLGRPR
jgi:hypothetical protein